MINPSTAPALFSVQDAYKGPYPARIQEFTEAGRKAGFSAAHEDREKIALVVVDYQHDFVDPTGTLYVPGSQDDVARLLGWFYTNAHRIAACTHRWIHICPFRFFTAPGGKT